MNKLQRAIEFATRAHQGQMRKVSGVAYVTHPIAVGNLLKMAGFNEDVVIAGYLHDTVEDTYVTFEDIQREFGSNVVELVRGNTENKSLSWIERKSHTIESIKNAQIEIKALIVADKLDNLQSLTNNYNELGDAIWEKFKGGPEKQKWYYQSVVEGAFEGLDEANIPDFFFQLKKTVDSFF
jgi:guanosine-3',5'-bis(diphosphate) 3'-pyrophosphohydrolase